MYAKLLFACLLAAAAADLLPTYDSSEESLESTEVKYSFNWAIDDDPSSNEFGHQETRDGDDTQGSYYVELPNGRLQKVVYTVYGDDGYQPLVTYSESDESDESDEFDESEESDESFEA
ncbi:pro-resilin-like [Panulirus ornatus]|uniref:pro-resilin-like n=1 Tax=Panulirus ornatus TaxID=150431 RepID=UPI003A86AA83